ncbi:MAG: type II toxin-antitoxin system Phd/YefM family antitoxin [Catenibacterium mitsuokai]
MKIIPMRDLKNTVEVERLCAEENGPVFVTKNGYCRLVVMNIEYYEKNMRKMDEVKTILDGLKDVKFENTVEGDAAISNIKNKYGI